MFEHSQLVIVAAIDQARGLGFDGHLPWQRPEDRRFFRRLTLDSTVIVGRKTFDSFPRTLDRRRIIVLSRTLESLRTDVVVAREWREIESLVTGERVYVIGGAQIYNQALPWCSELILTHVNSRYQCDSFFPEWAHLFNEEGQVLESWPECCMISHERRLYLPTALLAKWQ